MADEEGAPPRRPEMSNVAPAPVPVKVPPPRSMVISKVLWIVSLVLGASTLLLALLSQEAHLGRLDDLVNELATEQGIEAADAAAGIAFWGSLGALALITVLEAILVLVMLRGRGAARWVLLALLPLHFFVVLLTDAFLGLGDYGLVFSVMLLGQLLLAAIAVVFSLLPASSAWFRIQQQARLAVRG